MLAVEVADRVATVTLNSAPVNAVTSAWLERFEHVLDGLGARNDWHVLHVRSDQKVFCAGADLAQVRDYFEAADGPDRMFSFVAAIQRLFGRIEQLAQVTLVEIGGAAFGDGLELALACDLRIAASEAKLGLPEARLGLLPGAGGTQRLTRLCGRALAARLILGAEMLDGTSAAALGVVHWSAPRAELPARATELARRVADLPASAVAACKACIAAAAEPGRGGYLDELEHTRRQVRDPEAQRRVREFLS